jgi:flavin-binding protein dodecin
VPRFVEQAASEEYHLQQNALGGHMSMESVYKIIEIVGTSSQSWEKAAEAAISQASKSLRDLRVAEVSQLDLQLKDGKIEAYRAKLKVSFKFEAE